jgi:glycolate oxidase
VVGLEAVLPTGEIIQCGGKIVKNATGYNLINLLIGSEGTLAVITLAILRLLPLPLQKVSLLILYKNIESAIATVQEIITHKILPSAIELMEEEAIRVAEEYIGRKLLFSNHNYTCSLLIEIDGNRKDEVERDYEELGKIALKKGAIDVFVAEDKFQQQRLWESRRAISEALKSKGEVDHEDIVVPRSKIPDLLLKVKEIEKKYKIKIACYGHVGDGNIHVNILRENRSKSEWKNIIPLLVRELFECTLSLGGTISGEHGIGLAKKPYLRMAISDQQVELMRQIKKVFDPNNILNPGKIF